MSLAERAYAGSPVWAQHLMVTAFGWRWNRLRLKGRWPEFTREFRAREGWTHGHWQDHTTLAMRRLLTQAVQRVPHYQEEWRRLGITPDRIQRMEVADLFSLPILSKDIARARPESLLLDGVPPPRAHVFHTSGSTGTPLATYWTANDLQRSLALREARSAAWAGVSYLEPRATFSGRMVEPNPVSRGPYHRYNSIERQIYFSPFHLGPDTVGQYVAALRRHRPRWFNGYAYSYSTLARLMKEQGVDCPAPQAVVTTSEKVTAGMRAVMEEVFQCKVFEEYGTVEDIMYACECERGGLHVSPDAGIVEILDDAGRPAAQGQTGKVVATGFVREHQIFVRFALGDEAAWAEGGCPCGREMPLLKGVAGRIEDAVIGPDGREMVRFHGIFADQLHVVEGQIVQQTLDHILVKVVVSAGFGPDDVAGIRRRVQARLTPAVRVDVETVASIPRTKAGKYQAVVSHVPRSGTPAGRA